MPCLSRWELERLKRNKEIVMTDNENLALVCDWTIKKVHANWRSHHKLFFSDGTHYKYPVGTLNGQRVVFWLKTDEVLNFLKRKDNERKIGDYLTLLKVDAIVSRQKTDLRTILELTTEQAGNEINYISPWANDIPERIKGNLNALSLPQLQALSELLAW